MKAKTNKNKTKPKIQKLNHATYITTFTELTLFISSFILLIKYDNAADFIYFKNALIIFAVAMVILIGDLIYHRIIKYYEFTVQGKTITYKQFKFSEEKTLDKHKKYVQYSVDKKNIKDIKRKGLYIVIYGDITKKDMEGREITNSWGVSKVIIPYYINEGKIAKDFKLN